MDVERYDTLMLYFYDGLIFKEIYSLWIKWGGFCCLPFINDVFQ